MSKQQLRVAKAKHMAAKGRVIDLRRLLVREEAVRAGVETRSEREIVRKRIFALRKQIRAAALDVKRAGDLVRYFANPEIKEEQRERSKLLMRALRARRKAEAA